MAQPNGDAHHHHSGGSMDKLKEKLHHLHLEDAKIHLIHQKYRLLPHHPPAIMDDR